MFLQLLTLLTLWSSLGSAHPLSGLASLSTPHFHQPHIFTRLRNGLGKMTPSSWRPVVPSPSHSPDASSYNSPKPSGTFRERYDRDLVLRFNISTEEEASSLAEAVDTLFLDVWEFTPASADIRLAKDVVRIRCSRQDQLLTQPGPFLIGSFAEIHATCTQAFDARSCSDCLRVPAFVCGY